MLERVDYLRQIAQATARSPVTALLGPRQCGKTTMARAFAATREATLFDLESEVDLSEAPDVTRSMHNVVDDLRLDHLFVVCPSRQSYPVHERISVLSLLDLSDLTLRIDEALR